MTYYWGNERKAQKGTQEWCKAMDAEFWDISRDFAHHDYPFTRRKKSIAPIAKG